MGDALAGRDGRVDFIRSAQGVRERCQALWAIGLRDQLPGFRVHPERLPDVAHFVAEVTRKAYPTLAIPFHSRWRHFDAGGASRLSILDEALAHESMLERARAKVDLAFVSVLLDAGAGPQWGFRDALSGTTLARSEGLAVASFELFMAGAFSRDPVGAPFRVDAAALKTLDPDVLRRGFQVGPQNPLVGLEGRTELLRTLGHVLEAARPWYGTSDGSVRPGGLVTSLEHDAAAAGKPKAVEAPRVLSVLLETLVTLWPHRRILDGVSLGDVGTHGSLGAPGTWEALVPFHKLSQWLTYSLLEPLAEAGLSVDPHGLTGLAEYRNGGLFVDSGVLEPREPVVFEKVHRHDDEFIVEWRALTVALVDILAQGVREALGESEVSFPLAKVLEGGTWRAGRLRAAERRPGGAPPFRIESDGTVF